MPATEAAAAAAAAPASAAGGAAASSPATAAPASAHAATPPPAPRVTRYALLDGIVTVASAFTSSGCWRGLDNHDVAHGVLKGTSGQGAWVAADEHAKRGCWVQLDLGSPMEVAGVETQGRAAGDYTQWVTRYRVFASADGEVWDAVGTFDGNFDQHTRVRNKLPAPVTARYVRLVPLEHHEWPSLRWDVIVVVAAVSWDVV